MVALSKQAAAVYLLDDDASILQATHRLLDSAGWNNVESFTDPNAFLQRAASLLRILSRSEDYRGGIEFALNQRRSVPIG